METCEQNEDKQPTDKSSSNEENEDELQNIVPHLNDVPVALTPSENEKSLNETERSDLPNTDVGQGIKRKSDNSPKEEEAKKICRPEDSAPPAAVISPPIEKESQNDETLDASFAANYNNMNYPTQGIQSYFNPDESDKHPIHEEPTDYSLREQPVEHSAPGRPIEHSPPGRPIEYPLPEQPTEYPLPEQQTEYSLHDQPSEYSLHDQMIEHPPQEQLTQEPFPELGQMDTASPSKPPPSEQSVESAAEIINPGAKSLEARANVPLEAVKESSNSMSIHEKLREMGEISVKPVSKVGESLQSTAKPKEGESEVSVEIKKRAAEADAELKRITNLRKNIRGVMDENQLDATTLAAQRQESERLARVQVQQKIIRELQRQMAVERLNNRTQNRVLSLLQGQTSLLKSSSSASERMSSQSGQSSQSAGGSSDMYIVKGVASEVTFKGSNFVDIDKFASASLTPSVSIAPVRRMKSMIDSDYSDEESESEESDKKEVVEISSDDDCIVLSDDEEEEEEPEDDPHNSGLHVKDAYNIPDEQGRVLINIGHPENEEDIFLAPQIARIIKPHQIGGVRFLYDNIIESTERFSTSTGFGCILAHSMGLGKTLQVVCFCDIFLRHTNSKSILCILPINTLQNWLSEFNMWLPEDPEKSPMSAHGEVRARNFKIFVLNDQQKSLTARSKVILEWARDGGVLLIGYELFRLLSLKLANKKKKNKKGNPEKEKAETEAHKRVMDEIHSALVRPGPDLVICDEGHRIKNSHASISVALKQIRSKRRIVLTGYPLQNNLLEYWCMVDFVRPNYLGTKTEFANMFERPIQNGQCVDSTPQDVKLMRYRAHVLHSLLVGFVQRRSHIVLQNSLPQKEEYVILVRMTSFQRKLYNTFMNDVVRTKAVPNPLKAFAVCCKIWNHPDVLYNFLKKREADLDLELEEVEAEPAKEPVPVKESKPAKESAPTPTSNRGRKKGSTNKTTKGVTKNGKTIPAVEVQPNQGKVSPIAKGPSSGDDLKAENDAVRQVTPTSNEQSHKPNNEPTLPVEQLVPQLSPGAPTDYSKPEMSTCAQPQSLTDHGAALNDNTQPTNNTYSHIPPEFSNQHPNNFPAPPNQHYSSNFSPYNPYEYDSYYGHQYGNMYPPPQQYHGHSYDQSYMGNAQNNYWQNNYYGYNNGTTQMNTDPYGQGDPSYAGLVPKATESFDTSKPPSAEEKSSEIVDLDTKEIKTVEPAVVEEAKNMKTNVEIFDIKKEESENDTKDKNGLKSLIEIKEEKVEKEVNEKDKEDSGEDSIVTPPEKEKETVKVSAKDDGIPYDWALEFMKGYVPDLLENSPKMVIFFHLLEESVKMGDRILVFSQSLLTLNLIERFLQKSTVPGCDFNWAKNTTYFRLDGSTSAIEREKLINEFNANPHIHLFLVSTRAGSLGINLVGANRVIVFDASWNPCHDTQAVCRVYRYGQKKPCFVYRIVMDNCLEKKIYDRQINKQGMSDRVVDECNPDAHLSMKEVTNLCYDNDEEIESKDLAECKDKYLDVIMQKIIELHSDLLSKEPFHHESLLVDRKEKKLSQAEKRLAQRGYEMEKRAAAKPAYVYHSMGTQYRIMKTPDGSIVHRPVASVRPMQAEGGERGHIPRPGGVRPTRWIPAEVWQRQGMTAQEMTLPLDVVIPTSSGDKSNIVLKAGQKVMVLKSPKGIYMQLETGKIIAIRTSLKMGQAQNKDKGEDTGIPPSSATNSDEIQTKSSSKGDHKLSHLPPSSNTSASNMLGSISAKQQGFPAEAARSGKPVDSSAPTAPFKQNTLVQNRSFSSQQSSNSKNFNVQNLIDSKSSSGPQGIYSHSKGLDLLVPENRSSNSMSNAISKANLYNAATKVNYPRSNYSFTNALKQAQTHSSQQSLLANVKPQMHDPKMWEQDKNQSGKNIEPILPTITIDDDIDPPLREKVVYKPNLIERKSKHSTHRSVTKSPSATAVSASYSKQMHGKNVSSESASAGSGFKSPENLRQLHNVKPYNRQYPEQRNGSNNNSKSMEESVQNQLAASNLDGKSSNGRGKMPSIRNIPAPYPSISMAGSSKGHSGPSYTQSNMSMTQSSQNSVQSSQSYNSGQTPDQSRDKDYPTKLKPKSQNKVEPPNARSEFNVSETLLGSGKQHNSTNQSPSTAQPLSSVANQQHAAHQMQANVAASEISALSQTNSDSQYSNYNPQQTTNTYNPTNSESTYNYPRNDSAPYQSYPDIYAAGPPNPYGYPPTPQHPPSQSNYPYGSYYDHQVYGNPTAAQGYSSGASVPPPTGPPQHSQYHYSNYQPPSNLTPHASDPYNSYYNYPPYPSQTGQWQ